MFVEWGEVDTPMHTMSLLELRKNIDKNFKKFLDKFSGKVYLNKTSDYESTLWIRRREKKLESCFSSSRNSL